VPEFFSSGARGVPKGTVALVAPFPRDTSTSEPMLWQAAADMRYRMPAGYALGPDRSGRFSYLPEPTELSRTMERIQQTGELPDLTTVERAALEVDLRRSGVAVVIVGNMPKRPAMILFFTELLERPPERVDDVDIWFDIGP
jgi:hypothetical protein